ncbi:DUF4270 domain-containing protein [Alistipes sp. OttesenSCG-928-B03]|nr:DUF4270 domain-containing protein [Alistipes sp. OttesenSCG-928-B03]
MGKQLLAAIALLSAVFHGCDTNGMEIGDNLVSVHSRVLLIDTCMVESSSVLLDSVPTSSGGRIFAGIHRSPHWGETAVSTYMTFNLTSDYESGYSPQNIHFDSLTLYMVPDATMFSGDTLQRATFEVYRLAEQLQLNDYGELYGHSTFECEPEPIAIRSFFPRPASGRELEIRLPDELGHELLDKLVNKDEDVESDGNFKKYFRGIALTPDPSCESIMSFKGSDTICMMKLYYHTITDLEEEHVLDFTLYNYNMFTHVESDRTGAPLDGISFKNNEIASTLSDNKSFVEGLSGIYTRVSFPHLNNIRGLGDYGTVVSATLLMYPYAGSYRGQDYRPLPQSLTLYMSNDMNETIGAVTNSSSSEAQAGQLTYHDEFPEKTYYSFDITDFVKQQLGKIGANKRTLQIIDTDYGYTLGSLVVGDQTDTQKNIELHITYSVFNEN